MSEFLPELGREEKVLRRAAYPVMDVFGVRRPVERAVDFHGVEEPAVILQFVNLSSGIEIAFPGGMPPQRIPLVKLELKIV